VVWLGVWRGWLSSEWGYWSLSTAALVAAIFLVSRRHIPGHGREDGE
jgi:hypothetical protein